MMIYVLGEDNDEGVKGEGRRVSGESVPCNSKNILGNIFIFSENSLPTLATFFLFS
jgi:hypothetical protein